MRINLPQVPQVAEWVEMVSNLAYTFKAPSPAGWQLPIPTPSHGLQGSTGCPGQAGQPRWGPQAPGNSGLRRKRWNAPKTPAQWGTERRSSCRPARPTRQLFLSGGGGSCWELPAGGLGLSGSHSNQTTIPDHFPAAASEEVGGNTAYRLLGPPSTREQRGRDRTGRGCAWPGVGGPLGFSHWTTEMNPSRHKMSLYPRERGWAPSLWMDCGKSQPGVQGKMGGNPRASLLLPLIGE